jgi:DNA-binding NarL/FixJ family response regulator
VFNALAAGASGYLLKLATRSELLEASQRVHAGGSPMTSHIARKVVQSFHRPVPTKTEATKLSSREQQVLELLVKGFLGLGCQSRGWSLFYVLATPGWHASAWG